MRATLQRAPVDGGPGLARLAALLVRNARALAADYALLAVLDARSAAIRFAWLVSGGLAAAILVVTAWMALVAALLVWLLGSGASWYVALGVAALINVAGAVAIALWLRRQLTELPFAATLRQLKGDPAAPPAAADAPTGSH
jgi:hypothetical protein